MNSTPLIHCGDGITAVIPEHLQELNITKKWLKEKKACSEGLNAFHGRFPDGSTYHELRAWLVEIKRPDWETWIQNVVGGDVATAGDSGTATAGVRGTATAGDSGTATAGVRGTATAGVRGTATAGYAGTATAGDSGTATAGVRGTATAGYAGTATAGVRGTATAGYAGTATAGDSGTATAGVRGTATAGYAGTATAGYAGTATAGENGVISITYYDHKAGRYKVVIGYIGESGLLAGKKYRLNEQAQFEEVQG